jgi:hypothetical protein
VKHGDDATLGIAPGVCFAAGTPVETRDGLVAIEEIEAGDVVLSRDPGTGETAWRSVTRTFVTPDQAVLRLELVGKGGGPELLLVTGEHPFWVSERGWVAAQDLEPGLLVLSSSGGWLRVGSGTWQPTRETVYNFEVDEFHTYFVGTGGAWVHNTCQAKLPGKPKSAVDGPKVGSAEAVDAGKRFPDSVKEQARAESGGKCVFCGTKTGDAPGPTQSEIDHAIPKSRGGDNTINNAQNTCRTCNRSKGAKTSEEFLE